MNVVDTYSSISSNLVLCIQQTVQQVMLYINKMNKFFIAMINVTYKSTACTKVQVLVYTSIYYAKQKHLGCKKGEANQKQQLSDIAAIKSFDIS